MKSKCIVKLVSYIWIIFMVVKGKNTNKTTNQKTDVDMSNVKQVKMKKNGKDIREIIFLKINNDFSWGKYADFKVCIMKKNGWINATKMVQMINEETGKKKPFSQWKVTDSAKELIEFWSVGYPTDQYLITIGANGAINDIRGAYIHPDLIPHVASWASPKFALKVSKIVNEYYSKKAYKETQRKIIEQKCQIEEKDDTIVQLNKKMNRIMSGNEELLEKNKKINRRVKRLLEVNNDMYEQNETIQNKLDNISSDRVVHTGKKSDKPQFIVFKNNYDPDDYDDDEELPPNYSVARVLGKCANKKIGDHETKYPDSKIAVFSIAFSGNFK